MAEFRVVLQTDRLDECVAFYVDMLGRSVVKQWDEPSRGRIMGFGDGRIELMESTAPTAPSGVMVAIELEDSPTAIDDLADHLVASGCTLDQPPTDQPWGHRNVSVTDPAGLQLTFYVDVAAPS